MGVGVLVGVFVELLVEVGVKELVLLLVNVVEAVGVGLDVRVRLLV